METRNVGAQIKVVHFTHPSRVFRSLSYLYLKEKFSDVTIIIGGKRLPAHKTILSERSKIFNSYFAQDCPTLNEITVTDVPQQVFLNFLKYLYTGDITISSATAVTQSLLRLAHQHSVEDLQKILIKELNSVLSMRNVFSIFNLANLYDFNELRDACHFFMDSNAPEILSNDCFNDLTKKSVINLLERDTFVAPEIAIFRSLVKWCERNNNVEDLVIQCVRLSSLTESELENIVWPSGLVKAENVFQALSEISGLEPKTTQPRTPLVFDENIATLQHGAEVISGMRTSHLLAGNMETFQCAVASINGVNGLVIKLGTPMYVNCIQMGLWDLDKRYYSYYIEVSLDQRNWLRVIDFSSFACRSNQELYFEPRLAKYIKIVGMFTSEIDEGVFHLVYMEAYLRSRVPKFKNGIVYPCENVATSARNALFTFKFNPMYPYDTFQKYCGKIMGIGRTIIVQLAQPFMIGSIMLILQDNDWPSYEYSLETSVNERNWELVDRRKVSAVDLAADVHLMQFSNFKERPVVFVRITGTHKKCMLRLIEIECRAL